MANYEQVNQELETQKKQFMLLETDEERKAFINGANDACSRAEALNNFTEVGYEHKRDTEPV